MKTYKPQSGKLMSWQDVKDWLASMNEQELSQAAFIYTVERERHDGYHSTEEKIIGTKTKKMGSGFEAPRLIGESANR